jgi:hypothetical protein
MSESGSSDNNDIDIDEINTATDEGGPVDREEEEEEEGGGGEGGPAAQELTETETETLTPEEQAAEQERLALKQVVRLQAVARRLRARLLLPDLLAGVYEKIYDPVQKRCFYYNKKTDTSTWKKPTLLGGSDMKKISSLYTEEEAVLMLQCWYRTYVGKKRVRRTYRRVVRVVKNAVGVGQFQNPRSKQNLWELPFFMGGELDHDYSSGSEEDEVRETRKEKRDRLERERKERKAVKRAEKAEKKAAKKEKRRLKREGAGDGDGDGDEGGGDQSDASGGSGSDSGSGSGSDSDSDSDSEYGSDSDDSVTSSVARDRRRLQRTQPRSRAQQLVDACEDREDKQASLALDLSGLGATRFTSRIYDLTHITRLVLSNNQLLRLNPDIKFLDKLELLDLRHNQLRRVPVELEELVLLKALLLGDNKLTTYPGNVYKLSHLETLDLSRNRFESVVVEVGNMALLKDTHEWEVGLGLLAGLDQLNAAGNNIGVWPGQVEKVRGLKLLNVASNVLTEIPATIEQNFNLLHLDLSHNQIESIPAEIYKLRFLETLKISHNKISKFPPVPPPQVIKDFDDSDVFVSDVFSIPLFLFMSFYRSDYSSLYCMTLCLT